MTDFPVNNNLSAFTPEIYSKKLARIAKQYSKFIERNTNRNWEGDIKNFGDVVHIAYPNPESIVVSFTKNAKDVCPVKQALTTGEMTLTIDNIAQYSMSFNDVELAQNQFNVLDGAAALAMQKLGDGKDRQVMVAAINETDNLKIGTAAAPVAVNKDNIYDYLVDARIALMNGGYLNGDGFYSFKGNQEEPEYLQPVYTCTPAIYGMMLKSTQLTHPTAAGDDLISRGQKSMMAGFEIDVNTVLTTITSTDVTGLAECELGIATTKMAITFASQMTKVEKLRDPDCFADIVRGIELYGFKVIHPKAIVVTFFNPQDPSANTTVAIQADNVTATVNNATADVTATTVNVTEQGAGA